MKDPTEELTGIFSSLWWWDISLTLNMTYFLSPIVGFADTSPEGGSDVSFVNYFYYIVPYFAEKINKYLVKFDKIFIFVFTFLSKCVKIYKNTT